MRYLQHLPLWRDANALLLAIEQAVRHFPRYHKYTLGTDLRRQAMGICRLVVRAYHDKPRQAQQVQRLILAIDDLKVLVQLGKEQRAFQRCDEFETLRGWPADRHITPVGHVPPLSRWHQDPSGVKGHDHASVHQHPS